MSPIVVYHVLYFTNQLVSTAPWQGAKKVENMGSSNPNLATGWGCREHQIQLDMAKVLSYCIRSKSLCALATGNVTRPIALDLIRQTFYRLAEWTDKTIWRGRRRDFSKTAVRVVFCVFAGIPLLHSALYQRQTKAISARRERRGPGLYNC